MQRQKPNILVTGTPGVGKSTFSQQLADRAGMKHLDVGKLIQEQKLYREWDDEMNCSVFEEDLVLGALEEILGEEGGHILDFHSCDFLPPEWLDLIIVLRSDNSVLFDRLAKRGYSPEKVQENLECEIFQVVLDEATEAFGTGRVMELRNDSVDQIEDNLDTVDKWIREGRGAQNGEER
uniref:Adenylate kinase isoenzyme 6 homolog n=1 Tax=Chromera velia CCMP2878 TaxID=1169474 RepID=A0A0G4HYZ9_9ALVE|mmetsp:Transcript_55207/g.107990  ORF Transcript_55207/g.107990 Transcript_55207/m.107990 type:complete len:179 (-) Transcript_55207:64-600(-)|eukprot:Cvel_33790.t1-p1 / transcript=Cvel_33790.t1 / gene=Cvel_33790 / organism=Chromera_velia_CCMP2878 / gene_product=Adenylate kinase isoenzyme 6 homolog, putative / transcript_product=Adenylate kinase isoenzyme 6 homolog, putative / location=Cvel_scaffold5596:879-1412(-) / protein_length=178 / sequence_SO=supercontig / SO=protein_coding / is_pseudo=false